MAIGPRFPIKEPDMHRVPREWQHIVCTCAEDHGTKTDLEQSIYMLCRKCSKFKRFYSSHCANCKQFYLMVFRHPAWTPRSNLCWDCCLKIVVAYPKRGGRSTAYQPPAEWVKPIPPKTDEEIAAGLDEFFSVVESTVDIDFDF